MQARAGDGRCGIHRLTMRDRAPGPRRRGWSSRTVGSDGEVRSRVAATGTTRSDAMRVAGAVAPWGLRQV